MSGTNLGGGALSDAESTVALSEKRVTWLFRLSAIGFASIWMCLIALSWANAAEEVDPEYRFSWLDPDKKVYVLQNRKFEKAGHLLISALGGSVHADPYRTAYSLDPRVAFYFTEALGIEAFGQWSFNSTNNAFSALIQSSSTALPIVRESRSQMGGLLSWVPWYAKINFFNQILYFDWYLNAGLGLIQTAIDVRESKNDLIDYVNESRLGYFLGTGHYYHLNQWLGVRLDYTVGFFRAPILGNAGDPTWFSHSTFSAGLGVKL